MLETDALSFYLRAASVALASRSGSVMLGICAADTAAALAALKAWTSGLGLPRRLLHGLDLAGAPVTIDGCGLRTPHATPKLTLFWPCSALSGPSSSSTTPPAEMPSPAVTAETRAACSSRRACPMALSGASSEQSAAACRAADMVFCLRVCAGSTGTCRWACSTRRRERRCRAVHAELCVCNATRKVRLGACAPVPLLASRASRDRAPVAGAQRRQLHSHSGSLRDSSAARRGM